MNSFDNKDIQTNPIIKSINDVDNSFEAETASFEVNPPNTTLRIQRKVKLLTDLKKQDVIQWTSDLTDLVKTCNWNDEVASITLTSLLSPAIQTSLMDINNYDDKVTALLKLKYPPSKAFKYYNALSLVKQDHFLTLSEYVEAIKFVCVRLGLTKGFSSAEITAKEEESFYNGLTDGTKLEMARLNVSSYLEAYEVITSTETIMMEQIKGNAKKVSHSSKFSPRHPNQETHGQSRNAKYERPNENDDASWKRNKPYSNDNYKRNSSSNSSYKNNGKYCSFHKTTGHNTKDCRVLNGDQRREASPNERNSSRVNQIKDKPIPDTETEAQMNAIREKTPNTAILSISCSIDNRRVKTLVDTGASENYIAESLVRELQLPTDEVPQMSVELANGMNIDLHKKATVTFHIEEDRSIKYKSCFKVFPQLSSPLLLGMEFLLQNEASINFRKGTLTVGNRDFEIPNQKGNLGEMDKALCEKTKICTVTSLPKDVEELIQDYTLNNPVLGNIRTIQHRINLKDTTPINCKPYRIPLSKLGETQQELNKLLSLGVITKSDSPYCAPAFLIYKKQGGVRLVIDYRKLNSQTIPLNYPLPRIQDFLLQLKGSRVFSQLDLNLGYYQLSIHPEDRKFTSFVLNNQQFEFVRMPFGLSNAPRTFQRAMYSIFSSLPYVKIYLYDILIHSESEILHAQHIREVLNTAKENEMSINFKKSSFYKDEVTYLGSVINQHGVKADVSRVNSLNFKTPKGKKDIRKILGLIQWFRGFIPNCSLTTAFLSNLTKKDEPFLWDKEKHQKTKAILDKIKEQTLLYFPDPNQEFSLEADACDVGLGSVLYQDDKLIGFYSYKFTSTEANYTILEKELLGILKSLEHFRSIVFSSPIKIYTDSANLLFQTPISKRVQRWKLQLEEFDYKLQHIKGKENVGADCISRLHLIFEVPDAYFCDIDNLISLQQKDEVLIKRINHKEYQTLGIRGKSIICDYYDRIIIPNSYSEQFLKTAHFYLEHPGETILYLSLYRYFFIEQIKKKIQSITRGCHLCQINKSYNTTYGKLKGHITSDEPLTFISSDIYGPISCNDLNITAEHDQVYILTITDIFSKWTEIEFLYKITSEMITMVIEKNWFKKFKKPTKILTDNGPQYIATSFKDFCTAHKIEHVKSSPYNPTGNSLSERLNRQVGVVLRMTEGNSFKDIKQRICRRLNYCVDRTMGFSPFEKLQSKSILDFKERDLTQEIKKALEKQRENLKKITQKKNKNRTPYTYTVGQFVYRKKPSQRKTRFKMDWTA